MELSKPIVILFAASLALCGIAFGLAITFWLSHDPWIGYSGLTCLLLGISGVYIALDNAERQLGINSKPSASARRALY